MSRPETTIAQRLSAEGFSERMVKTFFRPFLGGIFFDRSLGTSSRLFEFVMRMLATGANCLPANGIGAVAEQMADGLDVRLGGYGMWGVEREASCVGAGGRGGSRVWLVRHPVYGGSDIRAMVVSGSVLERGGLLSRSPAGESHCRWLVCLEHEGTTA
eukprot:355469-Chlamydomonas_euryale.AAC.2